MASFREQEQQAAREQQIAENILRTARELYPIGAGFSLIEAGLTAEGKHLDADTIFRAISLLRGQGLLAPFLPEPRPPGAQRWVITTAGIEHLRAQGF